MTVRVLIARHVTLVYTRRQMFAVLKSHTFSSLLRHVSSGVLLEARDNRLVAMLSENERTGEDLLQRFNSAYGLATRTRAVMNFLRAIGTIDLTQAAMYQ